MSCARTWFSALPAGVLSFEHVGGREEFVALAEGVMVKCGAEVLVSTRQGVRGAELGKLRDKVDTGLGPWIAMKALKLTRRTNEHT